MCIRDSSNPEALIIISDWLNDNKVGTECWTFYRQSSGGYSIQRLDSGDLDMALLGSTPYAASAARRGKLKAVGMAHIKGSAEALITRAEFTEPKQLSNETFKATIATPKTSTTHYVALAVIANAGMDLTDVNLVFMSPDDIKDAWDAGDIDGACIWGTTMQYMLDNGGRAMVLIAMDTLAGLLMYGTSTIRNEHDEATRRGFLLTHGRRFGSRSRVSRIFRGVGLAKKMNMEGDGISVVP